MISPETIDAMVAAGASAEVIAAAWKAEIAAQQTRLTERRAKDADRQRRHRASRDVTVTECDSAPPPEEKSPHTPIKPNPHLQNPLKGSKGSASNGKRLDPDWEPNPFSAGSKAAAVAAERGEVWLAEQFEQFRNHFLAKPGAAGRSVDWQLSWANWVGRAPNFDRSRSPPPFDHRQQTPDFSKIAGNYS